MKSPGKQYTQLYSLAAGEKKIGNKDLKVCHLATEHSYHLTFFTLKMPIASARDVEGRPARE